jgi:hypothetical protein
MALCIKKLETLKPLVVQAFKAARQQQLAAGGSGS